VGIGLTLLPVFYAHSDFGGTAPKVGQRRFLNDLDSFADLVEATAARLPDDAMLGIAPHSLRAVTADELRRLLTMRSDAPIHIHAAEQVKEVEASLAFSGARPVEWLLDNAEVDDRWCLIHATHMTEDETDRLARSGAVVGLCPLTEANLGDGIFPAQRYLEAGGKIGVGSDSNILIDAAQELRGIEYSQRLTHRARSVLASQAKPSVGGTLFNAALSGGARALGIESGIAPGLRADIITLNIDHPSLYGRSDDQWLDAWIFAANSSCIDAVWRRGRKLVSNGTHHFGDAIRAQYKRTLNRILQA
jgi:formimidoylglutamate deiminase